MADLLSEHNTTIKENLYVLLLNENYELDRRYKDGLFDSSKAFFSDKQKAHTRFWNRYVRPPRREFWDYMVQRRDLLVPQDVRERKGSYFTPKIWVEKSQEYLAKVLGESWQDEYYIWDCCAGTGNMEFGLTNKYNVWASTIDQADVDVMKDQIRNGFNLLESHVFQFDFLNDDFSKLPEGLRDIINDEEKQRKLVVYINPPYVEPSSNGKKSKKGVNQSKIHDKYLKEMSTAGREIYAQFLLRIKMEIPYCILGEFSKLKTLLGASFCNYRRYFDVKLIKGFAVPSTKFDNVSGNFPIGFKIWNLLEKNDSKYFDLDVYDNKSNFLGIKKFYVPQSKNEYINKWITSFKSKEEGGIGFLAGTNGNDFEQNSIVYMLNEKSQMSNPRGLWVNRNNLIAISIYFAVRRCMEYTWLKDKDQFLYPKDEWKNDKEFMSDCLTFTLFHESNTIQSQYGTNYWIPFTEQEVEAKDRFASHFMTDFVKGKFGYEGQLQQNVQQELFSIETESFVPTEPIQFSAEAQSVFNAGQELWRYYHSYPNVNVNGSLYDIREFFKGRDENGKVNSYCDDKRYNELNGKLTSSLDELAKKIERKVFDYVFLK